MRNYRIVQKDVEELLRIEYSLTAYTKFYCVELCLFDGIQRGSTWLSSNIEETARGWTFTTKELTGLPIKIFLDKEHFEKIEE